jgi:error-prone DNA polymerase
VGVRAFSEASLPLLDARPTVRDLEPTVSLPKLTMGEQVVDDYSTISMSLRAHPLQLLRPDAVGATHGAFAKLREAQSATFLQIAGTGAGAPAARHGFRRGVRQPWKTSSASPTSWSGPRCSKPSPHRHGRAPARRRRQGPARCAGGRKPGIVIHLVAERLWDWSADLDRIADLDGHFELRQARRPGHSSTPDPRDEPKPRPNLKKDPAKKPPYDRSRIIFDRPQIKIASRDFH